MPGRTLRGRTLTPLLSLRGAVLMAAVFAVIGILQFTVVDSLQDRAREIVNQRLPGLAQAAAANASFSDSFFLAQRVVLETNPATRARLQEQLLTSASDTSGHLRNYELLISSEDDRVIYDRFVAARIHYRELRAQAIVLAETGNPDEARRFFEASVMPAFDQCKDLSDTLLQYNTRESEELGRGMIRICTITRVAQCTNVAQAQRIEQVIDNLWQIGRAHV